MIVEILLLLGAFLAYKLWRIHMRSTYWEELGIKTPKMTPILGNNPFISLDLILQKKNVNDVAREQYMAMKGEKIYGFYTFGTPGLIITDPELIKQV